MRRRDMLALTGAFLVMRPGMAVGQQPGKVYRLGWLTPNTVTGAPETEFLQALQENGYIEGKNLVIDVRDTAGHIDRYAQLADELIALKPDCIVAMGAGATRAAKHATTTIPIVMGNADRSGANSA